MNGEYLKRCSKCKGYYEQTEFHANAAKPDGLQSECKRCQADRANTAARRYDIAERMVDIASQPFKWISTAVNCLFMPFAWIDRLIPNRK